MKSIKKRMDMMDNAKHKLLDTQEQLTDNDIRNLPKRISIETIRQTRKNRLVIIMLSMFGDESSDETEERVFAVAGIAGTQEEWDILQPIWLERTGGKLFHASDCESDRGEYKGIPHGENLKLYADLVNILVRTHLMGFGAVIDLKGHREFFPDVVENVPYHFCFRQVVMWFARIAYFSVPQQKVKFTFDRNIRTNYSSEVLFEWMLNLPDFEWKFSSYIDEISFASQKSVGIQAADIIAREGMKYCENVFLGNHKRPVRKSYQVLSETGRFLFDYYNRQYFESYEKQFKDLEKISGFNRNDYEQWLLKNKLNADNLINRHRFLIYWENTIYETTND